MAAPDILFITRKWAPAVGGMETWSHQLSAQLARLAPVEVIALPGRANGHPPTAAALLAFPLTVLRRYLARKKAPDVLHLGDMAIWPLALISGFGQGRPRLVLSAHGTDVSFPRRGGIRGKFYGAYQRLGARLISQALVIANSPATEAAARELGWRNTLVIPLATDLVVSQFDRPPGRHLLFAGRLIRQKGCGWFVREVLPLLPSGTELHIAGTLIDPEEGRVCENPQVRYLGVLPPEQLAEAYAEALCVVVPNIVLDNGEFEGFGLVAVEAAAAGGIVVAADCGGIPAAVSDHTTGFLVESGNPAAWAARIAQIANWDASTRCSFISASLQQVEARYRWPRVAQAVLDAYRPIQSNPPEISK
jgi:glycosyltransferase involved in cell wall biosynthesis